VKFETSCLIAALAVAVSATPAAFGADHLDAPLASEDGRVDINDLYAFQSPNNPSNTVLIMTVNPFAGVLSPTTFAEEVEYGFNIDTNGDALADIEYVSRFYSPVGGTQEVLFERHDSNGVFLLGQGNTGGAFNTNNGGQMIADVFDDPFFFDLAGFNDGLNFTGEDTLAGANTSAIVLELPSSELGATNIGVWATTTLQGHRIDRIGRPAINTVLIPSARKDEFNQAEPVNDPDAFGDDVRAAILSLSGDAAHAATLTDILLPDVLTIDTSSSAGFLNGRQLADDVIDAELNLLTRGGVTGDGVDANNVPFLNVFPYLAGPNPVPEPASLILAATGLGAVATRRSRKPH